MHPALGFTVGYQHLENSVHAQNKQNEFAVVKGWITNVGAASITGAVPTVKGSWGTDPDEIAVAKQIVANHGGSNVPTTLSEELGDLGAVYMLLCLFQASGTKYDDNRLFLGSGNNVFDAVYICGTWHNPQFAVVIEAKGTKKKPQAGERKQIYTGAKNGALVSQGTTAYLEEEIQVVKHLADPTWQGVGTALEKLFVAKKNALIYIGVQSSYSATQIFVPTIWFGITA